MYSKKINFIDNIPIKGHKFHEPSDMNPNGFKLFMTSAFIGPPRSGKTLSCINLAKYLQANNLVTEIILISPTQDNNPFHVLDIKDENKITDLDDVETQLYNINEYCKDKVKKWKDMKKSISEKKYNEYYRTIYKLFKYNKRHPDLIEDDEDLMLTDEDYEILEDNHYNKESFYYKVGPSFLIIADDINGSDVITEKKKHPLLQIVSNHRHNHINLFVLIQSYTNGLPPKIRRLLKQFFLYKFTDLHEIEQFYREIASSYFSNLDDFRTLYKKVTNVPHNFLLVDNDPKNDNLRVRQNFNELIMLDDLPKQPPQEYNPPFTEKTEKLKRRKPRKQIESDPLPEPIVKSAIKKK